MGLFKKRNQKEEKKKVKEDFSELPELPKLANFSDSPRFPELNEDFSEDSLPQLPKYPTSKFGNKFSQNTIKEAVTGGKEEEFLADDFDDEQMMPEFPKLNLARPKFNFPIKMGETKDSKARSKSPVFINDFLFLFYFRKKIFFNFFYLIFHQLCLISPL